MLLVRYNKLASLPEDIGTFLAVNVGLRFFTLNTDGSPLLHTEHTTRCMGLRCVTLDTLHYPLPSEKRTTQKVGRTCTLNTEHAPL